jgi:hypothetical protein
MTQGINSLAVMRLVQDLSRAISINAISKPLCSSTRGRKFAYQFYTVNTLP